jgi:hypothetical protein
MAKNPKISKLDPAQILKRVYDEDQDLIRTGANLQVSGDLDVAISAQTGDNIAISDGSRTVAISSVNGVDSLAVNIVGGVINSSPQGLSTSIKTTRLIVTDTPTSLPPTSLSGRNTLSVRIMGVNTVFFGSSTVSPTTGYPKYSNEEIFCDVRDNASTRLFAVCESGQTSEVAIIELA